MKTIFNSLGSNYDLSFVLRSFLGFGTDGSNRRLVSLLQRKYDGSIVLLYKGREAIKLALDILELPKGSRIGINGFTCFAVYKAIVDAGHTPVYLDIDGRDLNFSANELKSKGGGIRVLIVQNTLGSPCNISEIKKYCFNEKMFLIEDLAHSVGSKYEEGSEAGKVGDFTALSFSQDKMIDSVSGGALVIRNKKYQKSKYASRMKLGLQVQLKDRLYPLWTFLIRNLYSIGIGKFLHFILKKLGLLSRPISDISSISFHELPKWYSCLAVGNFETLDANLDHRRKIAKIYASKIDKNLLSPSTINKIDLSSNLRFPIFTKNRMKLIDFLKNKGVYISDIWYDAPIAPSRFLKFTNYADECPVSQKLSEEILNLPTHMNVLERDAIYISDNINKWLNSQ